MQVAFATLTIVAISQCTLRTELHVKKRNHKILEILEKALRVALPAWEESTKNTDHTEKALHVKKKPQNTRNTRKRTASVGQQARHSRIPTSGAAGCGVTLHRLPTSPRFNKQLHAIPHPNGEKCQNLQKSPLEIKSTVSHGISDHSHFTFCGGAVYFFQGRKELQLKE